MLLLFVVLESPNRVTGMPPVKYFPDPASAASAPNASLSGADHPARIDGGHANAADVLFIAAAKEIVRHVRYAGIVGRGIRARAGIIGSQPAKLIPAVLLLAAVMMAYPICIWPPSIFSTAEDFREPISLLMTRIVGHPE